MVQLCEDLRRIDAQPINPALEGPSVPLENDGSGGVASMVLPTVSPMLSEFSDEYDLVLGRPGPPSLFRRHASRSSILRLSSLHRSLFEVITSRTQTGLSRMQSQTNPKEPTPRSSSFDTHSKVSPRIRATFSGRVSPTTTPARQSVASKRTRAHKRCSGENSSEAKSPAIKPACASIRLSNQDPSFPNSPICSSGARSLFFRMPRCRRISSSQHL